MRPTCLFVATGDAVARLDIDPGRSVSSSLSLIGSGAQCVAVDPHDAHRVFVGTFEQGIYRTLDGGNSWEWVSESLPPQRILAMAISSVDRSRGRSVVYAGSEPSHLFRGEDDGRTWRDAPRLRELPSAPTWSFPPRPWTSHVRWIGLHPTDPATLYVGIELGGVMVSRDRGENWEDRQPGSQHDAHAIATHHAAPDRVYEAAGGGVAISDDAGRSWRPVDEGMDRHYAWGLAVDGVDPELWYVSASFGPRQAHRLDGGAEAILYRKRGESPWQPLGQPGGGDDHTLSRPHPVMPYALVAPRDQPNLLIAALHDGNLLVTDDAGESWSRRQTGLPSILAASEAAPP